jgi:hypothetical protein
MLTGGVLADKASRFRAPSIPEARGSCWRRTSGSRSNRPVPKRSPTHRYVHTSVAEAPSAPQRSHRPEVIDSQAAEDTQLRAMRSVRKSPCPLCCSAYSGVPPKLVSGSISFAFSMESAGIGKSHSNIAPIRLSWRCTSSITHFGQP